VPYAAQQQCYVSSWSILHSYLLVWFAVFFFSYLFCTDLLWWQREHLAWYVPLAEVLKSFSLVVPPDIEFLRKNGLFKHKVKVAVVVAVVIAVVNLQSRCVSLCIGCYRQPTPFDRVCYTVGPNGTSNGSRVFSDCDELMQRVMNRLLSADQLQEWESGRPARLAEYDKHRQCSLRAGDWNHPKFEFAMFTLKVCFRNPIPSNCVFFAMLCWLVLLASVSLFTYLVKLRKLFNLARC